MINNQLMLHLKHFIRCLPYFTAINEHDQFHFLKVKRILNILRRYFLERIVYQFTIPKNYRIETTSLVLKNMFNT